MEHRFCTSVHVVCSLAELAAIRSARLEERRLPAEEERVGLFVELRRHAEVEPWYASVLEQTEESAAQFAHVVVLNEFDAPTHPLALRPNRRTRERLLAWWSKQGFDREVQVLYLGALPPTLKAVLRTAFPQARIVATERLSMSPAGANPSRTVTRGGACGGTRDHEPTWPLPGTSAERRQSAQTWSRQQGLRADGWSRWLFKFLCRLVGSRRALRFSREPLQLLVETNWPWAERWAARLLARKLRRWGQ